MMIISNKRINRGYIIAFLLLLVAYFLVFLTIQQLIRETVVISSSYQLQNRLQSLKAEIADAETGVRGYIITRDVNYLKSYNSGIRNIPGVLAELEAMGSKKDVQKEKLAKLDRLVKTRMKFLTEGLKSFQMNGYRLTDEINLSRDSARITMDSIRVVIDRIIEGESNQMQLRKSKLSKFSSGAKSLAVVSLIITLFAIFYSWTTYRRENRARQEASEKAEQYRVQLENKVRELQEANSELDELRSIEKFAATGRIARTIAHEVRNPLTNISLAADQLKTSLSGSEDQQVLLEMIARNADRINKLVSELLNATRFAQLNFQAENINDLLDETLEMAMDRIQLNNIRLEKFYSTDICQVNVDKEKIKLAFLNIIVNAIEAMEKDKGLLQIRTKKTAGKCIVEIRDNGTGMNEETVEKLFDPYFTVKTGGTGLGLTNTQNIILNHKGNIKAYSKPGEGTSFVISLNIS